MSEIAETRAARTVWKFSLSAEEKIEVPSPSSIVHIGLDPQGYPCIWFEVVTTRPKETREFAIFGTGHDIPNGWKHRGSFMDAPFVWHVYELLDIDVEADA